MKQFFILYLLVFCIMSLFLTCDNSVSKSEQIPPEGSVLSFSECKYTGLAKTTENIPNTQACIYYKYDGESNLEIKHINAGFNCMPGSIYVEISFDENDFVIQEKERENPANCNCIYDVDIKINNLEKGNYTFSIVEPYLNENNEMINFSLSLDNTEEDSIFYDRHGYPWGE